MDYRRMCVVGMLAALVGCGPSAGGGDTGGGSTDADDGTGTDTATATSVGGSTGAPLSCEDFDDEPSTAAGTVQIRNVGAQTLMFNDPCFGFEYVQMTTVSDLQWPADLCALTCQNSFTEGCIDCGACAEAAYTVVAPGETITVDWDGRLYERQTPPDACFEGAQCQTSCQQARAAYDETVTVTVEAITVDDCLAAEKDPTVCECEAGPEGPCETYGSALIDPTVQAVIEIEPGTTDVVVEIGG